MEGVAVSDTYVSMLFKAACLFHSTKSLLTIEVKQNFSLNPQTSMYRGGEHCDV